MVLGALGSSTSGPWLSWDGAVICFLVFMKPSTLKLWSRCPHTKEGTLHFPVELCFFRHYLRDPILTSQTPQLADIGGSSSSLTHTGPCSVAISWFNSKKSLSSSIPARLKSSEIHVFGSAWLDINLLLEYLWERTAMRLKSRRNPSLSGTDWPATIQDEITREGR